MRWDEGRWGAVDGWMDGAEVEVDKVEGGRCRGVRYIEFCKV